MELAVPLVALGGLYIVSNQDNNHNNTNTNIRNSNIEGFQQQQPNRHMVKNSGEKKRVSFAPSQSNSMEQVYDSHDSRSKYYDGSYQKEKPNQRHSQMTSLTGEKMNVDNFSHNNK